MGITAGGHVTQIGHPLETATRGCEPIEHGRLHIGRHHLRKRAAAIEHPHRRLRRLGFTSGHRRGPSVVAAASLKARAGGRFAGLA